MLMVDRLRRLGLILLLPFVVRHAIDGLARFGIGQLDAALLGALAIPARQAIAAEAGEVHQIEILHVRALAQMRDQLAEGAGFELGAGLGVDIHDSLLRSSKYGVAAERLPHRGRASQGSASGRAPEARPLAWPPRRRQSGPGAARSRHGAGRAPKHDGAGCSRPARAPNRAGSCPRPRDPSRRAAQRAAAMQSALLRPRARRYARAARSLSSAA